MPTRSTKSKPPAKVNIKKRVELDDESSEEDIAPVDDIVDAEDTTDDDNDDVDEGVRDDGDDDDDVDEGGDDDEKCAYKYVYNEDDDDDVEELEDEDVNIFEQLEGKPTEQLNIITNIDDKISKPILFNYEYVKLLAIRAKQLSLGAKPMIKNYRGLTPKLIAHHEIKNKVIPLIILRPFFGNIKEQWKITEFTNIDDY